MFAESGLRYYDCRILGISWILGSVANVQDATQSALQRRSAEIAILIFVKVGLDLVMKHQF